MKIGSFDFYKNKTFIIAELSANHNGSLELAKKTFAQLNVRVLMLSNFRRTKRKLSH
jgi:hypothetical protein